jgi:hypothetical protein
MNGRPRLRIFLENVERRRVTDARVELARAGERRGVALGFDERRACFVGEADAGEYVLEVSAAGYVAASTPIRIEAQGLSTIITLGREEQPYYVVGGQRAYYARRTDAMAMRTREGDRRVIRLFKIPTTGCSFSAARSRSSRRTASHASSSRTRCGRSGCASLRRTASIRGSFASRSTASSDRSSATCPSG